MPLVVVACHHSLVLCVELAVDIARPKDPLDMIFVKSKLAVIVSPIVRHAPLRVRGGEGCNYGAVLRIQVFLVASPPTFDAVLRVPLGPDLIDVIRNLVTRRFIGRVLDHESPLIVKREVAPQVKHPRLG